MKIRVEKTRGDDVELLGTRIVSVSGVITDAVAKLREDGPARLEVDVEWPDGQRV